MMELLKFIKSNPESKSKREQQENDRPCKEQLDKIVAMVPKANKERQNDYVKS